MAADLLCDHAQQPAQQRDALRADVGIVKQRGVEIEYREILIELGHAPGALSQRLPCRIIIVKSRVATVKYLEITIKQCVSRLGPFRECRVAAVELRLPSIQCGVTGPIESLQLEDHMLQRPSLIIQQALRGGEVAKRGHHITGWAV